MEEYKRDCNTCNFRYLDLMEFPCSDCFCHGRWENPINDWLVEWLSSFDISSATECFTAVNLLREKLEAGNA